MKKLSLIILALFSIACKNAPKIAVGTCIYRVSAIKAQNVINYSDFVGHKYYLLVTNTVGATTPSNAVSVFAVSKDTTWLMLPNIKFSGVTTGTTVILPQSKVFSLNSSKMLCATDFSLVAFPYSQVTGTPVIPAIYTLTAADIYAKLTYTPYNGTNPSGYISSYTETDPLFNGKFTLKTTADLLEGSNLYYTAGRFNTAFSDKSTTDLTEGSNLYFTAARTRTTISAGTGISYVSGTGVVTNSLPDQVVSITAINSNVVVTGSYPSFTLTPYLPTTFTVSRAINSATFQPSSTRIAWVYYTVRINCVATIGGASSGTVALQYSINNGSTWVDVGQVENSNVVTLAIVLNSNITQTSVIAGMIPAGAIVRMNQTISGTTTITYIRGQETY